MNVTEEIKKKAAEIAGKRRIKTLFVNSRNEFFTEESYAANSVKGNKDNYTKIDTSAIVDSEKATTDDAFSGTAFELIERIEASESVEDIQEILTAEQAGKQRKTVIATAEKRIEELSKTE
ncbi:hypothetical protein LJC16_00745 [Bacteroidales bacterium OttesenSCG-928-C19]|nr:hypothetical protein [Bacteroidales bacterium OttesenSCG-928-C19]